MSPLQTYADAAGFLDAAAAYLRARPVEANVVTIAATRIRDGEAVSGRSDEVPFWFALTRDALGDVAGVAMRVGSYPAYLLDMTPQSAAVLAETILDRGEQPAGANGDAAAALAFAEAVAAARGGRTVLQRGARLHVLATLRPPPDVSGTARDATLDDLPLLAEWVRAFLAELDAGLPEGAAASHAEQADDAEAYVRAGIERELAWVWADPAGEQAALVMARSPALGVARIGPVYTPPEKRRNGYAAALTAHASARILGIGARVCLFTDLANPTSNGVYRRIGFEPVRDSVEIAVVDA